MNYLMQSAPGARSCINDRWRDYFAGTGYLGLQGHPALIEAAVDCVRTYGLSTATSRGGYGEHPVFKAVEDAARRFFETERAVYFSSGYLGNSVLTLGLQGEYERIFIDQASHYSVRDAVQMAGVPVTVFAHRDPEDLAIHCRAELRPGERPLVISDGVFPVSGELAPVPDYLQVLAAYDGAILCLDDAHATGVIGEKGQGTLEYYGEWIGAGADPAIPGGARRYAAHTLSKALAGHGGVIPGSPALVEKLAQNAKMLVGASLPPLPAASVSAWALELVMNDPEWRRKLWANVARAKQGLRELGWSLTGDPVPIICLGARPGLDLARLQAELFARDICVAHSTTYSSTPPGGALRVAIFATHTADQIDRLIAELGSLL